MSLILALFTILYFTQHKLNLKTNVLQFTLNVYKSVSVLDSLFYRHKNIELEEVRVKVMTLDKSTKKGCLHHYFFKSCYYQYIINYNKFHCR